MKKSRSKIVSDRPTQPADSYLTTLRESHHVLSPGPPSASTTERHWFQLDARHMAARIDPSEPFAIVGVSFGGMVAAEISEILEPQEVILVSSAKSREEFSLRYRLLRYLPLPEDVGSADKIAWRPGV